MRPYSLALALFIGASAIRNLVVGLCANERGTKFCWMRFTTCTNITSVNGWVLPLHRPLRVDEPSLTYSGRSEDCTASPRLNNQGIIHRAGEVSLPQSLRMAPWGLQSFVPERGPAQDTRPPLMVCHMTCTRANIELANGRLSCYAVCSG